MNQEKAGAAYYAQEETRAGTLRDLVSIEKGESAWIVRKASVEADLGDGRKSVSMDFPALVVCTFVDPAKGVAEKVAKLLDQDARVQRHMEAFSELDASKPYVEGRDTIMLALASLRATFLAYAEDGDGDERAKRNEDMAYLVGNVMGLIGYEREAAAEKAAKLASPTISVNSAPKYQPPVAG